MVIPTLEICQKFYTTGFSGKKIYTLKVPKLRLFYSKIISVNALISVILVDFFCKNLTECVNFNSFSAKSHLVYKSYSSMQNYVRICVVFWENLHSWHKFYTAAGRACLDKSQLCQIVNYCQWWWVFLPGFLHE